MEKERFTWVMLPEGAVIVTKEEMEALNEYTKKVRSSTIEAIFTDIEAIIIAGITAHRYSKAIYQTIYDDLQEIKRNHIEGENECLK